MIIYVVTCKSSGLQYVGQTTQPLKIRWRQHRNDSGCDYLYNAIKKYGAENFEIKEIARASSLDELNQLEKFWISKLNTIRPNGMNLKDGGNNGGSPCQETRDKIAKSLEGHEVPKDVRDKIAQSLFGKPSWNKGLKHTEEHKANLRKPKHGKTRKEKIITEKKDTKFKKGHTPWNLGVTHSKETRKKLSDANKGKVISEETKAKMSKSRKGKKHTPESIKKMSINRKKAWDRKKGLLNPTQLEINFE